MQTCRIALALMLAAASANGQDTPVKPAPPPNLKLTIPAGWQDLSKPPAPDKPGPAAITLATREDGGVFSVQIVFLRAPGRPDAFDDEALGMLLNKAAGPYLESSDQKEVKPQALDGPSTHGYFTTLTAKTAKAGESPCVTLAHLRLGDGLLAATIRHPDGSPNLPKALDMLKTATLAAPATQPAAAKPATKPAAKPLAPGLGRRPPNTLVK